MFSGASAFNSDISGWNTASVTNMAAAFQNATAFNQPIETWNTAAVTAMDSMFSGATAFNQPIGNWNVANVGPMNSMFGGAGHAFAQDISGWNIRRVTSMSGMFTGNNWGTANYDAALTAWADLADDDLKSQAITAFGTLSSGTQTRVTSNGHGMVAGSRVNISGTTNYDGDYNVLAAGTNTFDIAKAFVSNDATGTMKHRRSRNITANFGSNKYSTGTATTKRGVLTGTYSWTITDGGQL
jgi:surface protein